MRKVGLGRERQAARGLDLLALELLLEVPREVLRDRVRALDDLERDAGEVRDVRAERGAGDAVDELVEEDQLGNEEKSAGVCGEESDRT